MSEEAATPALTIRAGVVPADIELCVDIWTSALKARDGSVDHQTMGQRVRDAFENEIVRFSVATSPRYGFAFVQTVPAEAGTALLHYLAVDPAGSGSGVGRALLADAIEHTRNAGFTRLLLEVRDVNSRAIDLYTRQGFVAFGEPVPHPTAGYPMQSYVLELA